MVVILIALSNNGKRKYNNRSGGKRGWDKEIEGRTIVRRLDQKINRIG